MRWRWRWHGGAVRRCCHGRCWRRMLITASACAGDPQRELCDGGLFLALLRDVGLVVANTVEWPLLLDVTSDLAYVGLHGSEQLCASSYSDAEGEVWARRAVQWAAGETPAADERAWLVDEEAAAVRPRDVFVYFDNDAKVHAPFDAEDLRRKVDGRWGRRSSDRRWRGIRARRGFAGRREGRSAGRRARCPSGRRCRCALRQRRGFCRRAG